MKKQKNAGDWGQKDPEVLVISWRLRSGLHQRCPPGPLVPTKGPHSPEGRLSRDPSTDHHASDETKHALRKPSPATSPGPDGIPYTVWKRVHNITPGILRDLLSSLVVFGDHPPLLKKANGVVLHKPGKACYVSPASLDIIVLLTTVSKILEQVITVWLLAIADSKGLPQPN